MSHHEHDPMKGHHRLEGAARRRWWHVLVLRTRSDAGDHVVRSLWAYGVYSYVSGHRDAPLTPRAHFWWRLTDAGVITAGILLIVYWAR
jgi:hypothetical protein